MAANRAIKTFLALVAATLVLSIGSAAGAVDNPDYTAPAPAVEVANSMPPIQAVKATPAAAVDPASTRTSMALTGADIAQFAAIGAVLVIGGFGLVMVRRRQTA